MNRIFVMLILVCTTFFSNAQQERKYIRQGNRQYNKAIIDSITTDTTRYQKAEADYRSALERSPNNWDAAYNLGNSLYKQGKVEEAVQQFQAVSGMSIDDKNNIAKAYHNLGNSLLLANKLSEAVEAYKNSLRNNPNDFETKYNLAWAQEKMRQQQQQQKQDQENQDQDKDKKDQQNEDKKQQDKQNQEDQQKQQEQQQNQQEQQEQQNQSKISKEDALRILEALQNDEKQVQEKVQKQKVQPKKQTTEKDW